ncbi:MAG TPA: putative DNA modification/repair radical SAM protein [Spirochaetia bacterium]
MDTLQKLEILAGSARYDVSCSTSGSLRLNGPGGGRFGNAIPAGICHSFADDGRCVSLLKVLFTNVCINDCAYCVNRRSSSVRRVAFTVPELVSLTEAFYRRNYIEGLFLSSGIVRSPDFTMELLIRTARALREGSGFNGYIHLKIIPGCSPGLVREAGFWADRVSVNIELPSDGSLRLLAPEKQGRQILGFMGAINADIEENRESLPAPLRLPGLPRACGGKPSLSSSRFAPAGQSTQLIVGASPESDLRILGLSQNLYDRYRLRRVYYSAFMSVSVDARLPAPAVPPLRRENRLYQADWLLRFYKFRAEEIVDPGRPFLDLDVDPKCGWALRNRERFPVEVNTADYETLLRVPGLGVKSAQRIVQARRYARLDFDALTRIGVVMKRARWFLTCKGRALESREVESAILRRRLSQDEHLADVLRGQLLLFDDAVTGGARGAETVLPAAGPRALVPA